MKINEQKKWEKYINMRTCQAGFTWLSKGYGARGRRLEERAAAAIGSWGLCAWCSLRRGSQCYDRQAGVTAQVFHVSGKLCLVLSGSWVVQYMPLVGMTVTAVCWWPFFHNK